MRGGTKEQKEAFFGQDGTLDKRGRLGGRMNHSKCDSERKLQRIVGGYYSEGSDDLEQEGSSDKLSDEEFHRQRKSIRKKRGVSQGMLKGMQKAKERVATANVTNRHGGATYSNSRLFAKDKVDEPTLKHTDSKIALLH